MNRFALILTTLVFTGSGLQAASNEGTNSPLIDRLEDRIDSLETRVMQLESELKKLSLAPKPDAPSPGIPKPEPPSNTPASPPAGEGGKSVADSDKSAPGAEPAPSGRKIYLIGEGDTISLIAKKHGIPREELMKANGLREGQQIYIGDSLSIPNPPQGGFVTKNEPASKPGQTQPAPGGGAVYTVRDGDTLMRIARNHSTTVDAIKAANKLKGDLIGVGQKLQIPVSSSGRQTVADTRSKTEKAKAESPEGAGTPPNIGELREGETYGLYTVEKGDTLYSLARDFFTSPGEIQRLNKLGDSNTIRPGQDLVVPTSKYNEVHNKERQKDLAGR